MDSDAGPVFRTFDRAVLDREYNARESVASFEAEYAKYVEASVNTRRVTPPDAVLTYDPTSGETLDLYSAGPQSALFVWIHGGYWRSGSKVDNAFVASGFLKQGVSVAIIDYTLAPAVSLDEIVRQVRAAVVYLHRNAGTSGIPTGKLTIGGSSAGGHLTGMLLARDWHREYGLSDNPVSAALALSGLFDIGPLRHTHVDGWLGLDDASISRNSPIRLIPADSPIPLIASVGGLETSEFKRQTLDYVAVWKAAGNRATIARMDSCNHFDIALSLGDPASPLVAAVVKAIGDPRTPVQPNIGAL